MRRLLVPAVLLSFAAPAAADPVPSGPVLLESGKVCLDTLGGRHAPTCRNTDASRIQPEPNICLCPAGLQPVAAPYCAAGESPAPDSKDADRARLEASKANGSLMGATYRGQRFCVTRGRTGYSGG